MIGFNKKDLFIIKANLKSLLIIFVLYLMLAIQGTFDVTFIIPLIGIMLFISTFSYDDFNNWNSYAVTLPNGRKNVVRAKYIASNNFNDYFSNSIFGYRNRISYTKTNSINLDENYFITNGNNVVKCYYNFFTLSNNFQIWIYKWKNNIICSSIWNSRNRSFNCPIRRYDTYYKYDK